MFQQVVCFDSWNSKTASQSAELVEQTADRATQVGNDVDERIEGFKGQEFSIWRILCGCEECFWMDQHWCWVTANQLHWEQLCHLAS